MENLGKRLPTVDDDPSQVYSGLIDESGNSPRNPPMRWKSFLVFLAVQTLLWAAWFNPSSRADDRDPTRVLDGIPKDSRLGPAKDLNGYFPMKVPSSKEAWEKRRKEQRE